ncbi:MAG: hypothetical protein Q7V88_14865 [Actinomycetota bacterium]|nr:hypothetical protein [Actinomycetota bacterium]
MITNFQLVSEITRQRQSDMLARAERRHRLFRRPMTSGTPSHCAVIDLPVQRVHSSPGESLVA